MSDGFNISKKNIINIIILTLKYAFKSQIMESDM